jgi:hypothetical protein
MEVRASSLSIGDSVEVREFELREFSRQSGSVRGRRMVGGLAGAAPLLHVIFDRRQRAARCIQHIGGQHIGGQHIAFCGVQLGWRASARLPPHTASSASFLQCQANCCAR